MSAADIEREGMLSDMDTLRAEKRELRVEVERLTRERDNFQAGLVTAVEEIERLKQHGTSSKAQDRIAEAADFLVELAQDIASSWENDTCMMKGTADECRAMARKLRGET